MRHEAGEKPDATLQTRQDTHAHLNPIEDRTTHKQKQSAEQGFGFLHRQTLTFGLGREAKAREVESHRTNTTASKVLNNLPR